MLFRGKSSSRRRGLNPLRLTAAHVLQAPTLFLHGDLHDATAWHALSEELRDRTGPLYAVEYTGLEDGIRQIHETLASIRREYARHGIEEVRVNLVGHSMGGIVAAEFLRRHPEDVLRVITIGSRLRPLGHRFQFAYRGIAPVLARLHKWISQHASQLPLYTIAASRDWLVPREAAHANCPTKQYLVTDHGHISVLYAPETRRAVRQLLCS